MEANAQIGGNAHFVPIHVPRTAFQKIADTQKQRWRRKLQTRPRAQNERSLAYLAASGTATVCNMSNTQTGRALR